MIAMSSSRGFFALTRTTWEHSNALAAQWTIRGGGVKKIASRTWRWSMRRHSRIPGFVCSTTPRAIVVQGVDLRGTHWVRETDQRQIQIGSADKLSQ
jgi:hypothetical protein